MTGSLSLVCVLYRVGLKRSCMAFLTPQNSRIWLFVLIGNQQVNYFLSDYIQNKQKKKDKKFTSNKNILKIYTNIKLIFNFYYINIIITKHRQAWQGLIRVFKVLRGTSECDKWRNFPHRHQCMNHHVDWSVKDALWDKTSLITF